MHRSGRFCVFLRRVVALLAASLLGAPVFAGSLSVSPIRVDVAAGQRSVTLIVRNDGDQTTLVRRMDWPAP